MGRRIKLKAFIRYDSNGQVVAGSMKVQATKPLNGDWVEVPMHKDTSVTYPHYKLRAFVRYDNKNNLIFGGPVVASTAPKNGNWGETAYYKSDISSITTTSTTTNIPITTTTSTTTNPFIIDKSGENWYVVEIDSYFNILNLATYSSGGYTFIMPTGIPRSYYSSTAVTTLEGYGNIVTVDSTLISTDAILSWYASYTPTITYRTIDLSDYDARTSASDADKATIIANFNDLSVNDPVVTPIAFVGVESAYYDGASSLACNVPSGVSEGDMMFAFVNLSSAGQSCNTPSGWTLLLSETAPAAVTSSSFIFYKIASASEPASYTFDGFTGMRLTVAIAAYSNVAASPLDVYGFGESTGGVFTFTANSITTTQDNDMLIYAAMEDWFASTSVSSSPSGMNLRLTSPTGQVIILHDQVIETAGATGNKTMTTTDDFNRVLWMIAVKHA